MSLPNGHRLMLFACFSFSAMNRSFVSTSNNFTCHVLNEIEPHYKAVDAASIPYFTEKLTNIVNIIPRLFNDQSRAI